MIVDTFGPFKSLGLGLCENKAIAMYWLTLYTTVVQNQTGFVAVEKQKSATDK